MRTASSHPKPAAACAHQSHGAHTLSIESRSQTIDLKDYFIFRAIITALMQHGIAMCQSFDTSASLFRIDCDTDTPKTKDFTSSPTRERPRRTESVWSPARSARAMVLIGNRTSTGNDFSSLVLVRCLYSARWQPLRLAPWRTDQRRAKTAFITGCYSAAPSGRRPGRRCCSRRARSPPRGSCSR